MLQLIYRYLVVREAKADVIQSLKKHFNEAKYNLITIWNRQINSYQLAQLSFEEQEEINHLYHKLFEEITKLVSVPLDNFEITYDVEMAILDFEKNTTSYYSVIDRINGGGDQDYNDLPSIIVKQVKKFPLNVKGLSAILRPYQEFGAKYALTFKKILLGDEMGLGKTIQALSIANHLTQQGECHHIVIAPLTILTNWQREIEKWTKTNSYIFRSSNREAAFKAWQAHGGFLLLNYEQSRYLADEDFKELPNLVVVDEAHYIKNPHTKCSISTYQIAKEADYNLFMTGTPLENRLIEMKQLISILRPDIFNFTGAYEGFANECDDLPEKYKEDIATVYLRRKRDDVLKELPEIEMVEMWSHFSAKEQSYYNESIMMGHSGLQRMRRAGFAGKDKEHSEKIANVYNICHEANGNGDKVIIFSFFKLVLEKLKIILGDRVVGMISGDISTAERQNLIDKLEQSDSGAILLSQIEAGGIGLNIQAANIMILCEPQWKPSVEQQAIGRVYRMGQAKNVIVYRLLTEQSIDETMMELLGIKVDLFNQYAQNSVISDAFDRQNHDSIYEKELKNKVFEIERKRLEKVEIIKQK